MISWMIAPGPYLHGYCYDTGRYFQARMVGTQPSTTEPLPPVALWSVEADEGHTDTRDWEAWPGDPMALAVVTLGCEWYREYGAWPKDDDPRWLQQLMELEEGGPSW